MNVVRYLIMSLLVLLPASSFSFKHYFYEKALVNEVSDVELKLAVELALPKALALKYESLSPGSNAWINTLSQLAQHDGQYAYQLAHYYFSQKKIHQYNLWIKQSIKLGYHQAAVDLAKYYYLNEEYNLVVDLISEVNDELYREKTAKNNETSYLESLFFIKIKALLALGDIKQIAKERRLFADSAQSEQGNLLISELETFGVFNEEGNTSQITDASNLFSLSETNKHSQCGKSITLVATTYEDLQQLTQTQKQYSKHPFSQLICISRILYQPINDLACISYPSQAIMCDESYWQYRTAQVKSDYIGIMLPKGGANVHFGVMYFDRHDSFDVFIHELSHLLGFVDEYKLSKTHQACHLPLEAKGLNITLTKKKYAKRAKSPRELEAERVLLRGQLISNLPWKEQIKSTTKILTNTDTHWYVGTPVEQNHNVGLFIAETCQLEQEVSVKPMQKKTFLRHTGSELPQEYLEILRSNQYRYAMPSYYYNIAVSLFRKDEDLVAQKWLSLAHKANPKINKNALVN